MCNFTLVKSVEHSVLHEGSIMVYHDLGGDHVNLPGQLAKVFAELLVLLFPQ